MIIAEAATTWRGAWKEGEKAMQRNKRYKHCSKHIAAITTSTSQQQSCQTSLEHPLAFQSETNKNSLIKYHRANYLKYWRQCQQDEFTNRIKSFEESLDCIVRVSGANNLSLRQLKSKETLKFCCHQCSKNMIHASVTLDLTFLKPAKCSMVWTILPAFMPVLVGAGQRYTWGNMIQMYEFHNQTWQAKQKA